MCVGGGGGGGGVGGGEGKFWSSVRHYIHSDY